MGRRNSKTDIIWVKSIDSARDLLDYPQEKFDQNLMLWGGVTYKGLVPPRRPIFVDELKVMNHNPSCDCLKLTDFSTGFS